jgi:hypothetical protein
MWTDLTGSDENLWERKMREIYWVSERLSAFKEELFSVDLDGDDDDV